MYENIKLALDYAELCSQIDISLVEKPELIPHEEYSERELLKKEYELFGFYIQNHQNTLTK